MDEEAPAREVEGDRATEPVSSSGDDRGRHQSAGYSMQLLRAARQAVPSRGGPSDRGGGEKPSRKVRTPHGEGGGERPPRGTRGKRPQKHTGKGAAPPEPRTGQREKGPEKAPRAP